MRVFEVPLQVIKSVRKFGDTYIYGLLSSDKAVVGTVDMWLYR